MKVFSIYDSKAEIFLNPFMSKTKGEALRILSNVVNDPSHQFCMHAADFTLFELGAWDDVSAKYTMHMTPQSIGLLLEFKRE